ncbi:hypothetical protein [Bremerella sp. P1]|uniref:hypothetical protein n=1 Tax=Bremerella sp. P1 TaxID=3026424 RepID=UPI0023680E6D|nr:hypothetical protein [Bremerella sp. P1]WDI44002.1 hypothetical protein PSR63_08650 [Bremerella sp. P1]
MNLRYSLAIVSCFVFVTCAALTFAPGVQTIAAAPPASTDAPTPVEPDMHEFMEYVFQPTFKQLKPVMAQAPENNQGWKAMKAGSLILAEGGNLLLIRQPEKDAADWNKHSTEVRDFGGKFYRAAQAKDFENASANYKSMVQSCNACHHQFAGGEHILTP